MQTSEAEARLPRPPGVFRRALAAHPRAVDVFIVVWYGIGTCMGLGIDFIGAAQSPGSGSLGDWFAVPGFLEWPWWPIALLRTLVVAAALLFRRRFPLAGLIVVTLALFGPQGVTGAANGVALLFMLYAVPVYRSVAAGWAGYAIALVGTLLQYLWEFRTDGSALGSGAGSVLVADAGTGARSTGELIAVSIISALWYLAVVMLGINLGNRRRYIEAVIDRAHQLVRERDQLAQLAVAEERSRIAREMHDIVAHSVSVMIALSEGASRAATAAPEAAADAMRRSAETGRTALAEMRRLLGALHDDEQAADLVPQPGLEQLPQLVRSFEDAGISVGLEVSGTASGDRGQELAVYRVVQEGLTNVLRYAGVGAHADVRLCVSGSGVEIEIVDRGRAPGTNGPTSGIGSGRGLAGLAERVRVFGGRIESGPRPRDEGPGWRLAAYLPVDADASGGARPASAPPSAASPYGAPDRTVRAAHTQKETP
ncbi:two-component sensor histidine kinase [Leucobacter zeae]|nr:two-component sensor histidine kinase [Leucobacter zeae]